MASNKDNKLFLSNLSDGELKTIFKLEANEFTKYVTSIVERFFGLNHSEEELERLMLGVRSSLVLENIYRNSPVLGAGFSPVYTKHGMIQSLVNDIYLDDGTLSEN